MAGVKLAYRIEVIFGGYICDKHFAA